MIEKASKLVSSLASGMAGIRGNPDDNKPVSRHIAEALDILKALSIEHFFTITVCDDNSMLVNGVRILPNTMEEKKFFLKLRLKGIITIVISKGVRADELQRLLTDMASSGNIFHSYAHIAVKRCDRQTSSEAPSSGGGAGDDLLHVKRIYNDISIHRNIDISNVDSLVGNIITNIRTERHSLNPLLPLKENNDALYVHSLNAATLSVLQGERLGFGNALLYDIGFAALLHDIGKIMLPNHLLERQDSLSETEWALMKKHPAYGAALLASIGKSPEIAIVVAYEHHMKYDGTGYPETKRKARRQHIISQIVAIADFYCALGETGSAHRGPLCAASITGMLAAAAGREFNPFLVDNFIRALEGPASEPH